MAFKLLLRILLILPLPIGERDGWRTFSDGHSQFSAGEEWAINRGCMREGTENFRGFGMSTREVP